MKILTLHEEKVLEELESSLKQADKKAEIHAFTKTEDALAFLKENKVDAAFVGYRVEDKKPEAKPQKKAEPKAKTTKKK